MNPEKIKSEADAYPRQKTALETLAAHPPQTMLLEGGTEDGRFAMALYWAMLLNCPSLKNSSSNERSPCFRCPVCAQIAALEHFDLFIFDGRITNKEDEQGENLIKSLRKANIDYLKQTLGTEPRGVGKRSVIFMGMAQNREEAMNSLLKILEEPNKNTVFTLLAPLREQILSTLASRSLCVTLPQRQAEKSDTEIAWEASLCEFIEKGSSFFEKAAKTPVTFAVASNLAAACQRALIDAHASACPSSPLAVPFKVISSFPELSFQASQWISDANEMIQAGTSPARIMEALACRLNIVYAKAKKNI